MASVLVTLGLLPVEIEAPRQEYLSCLNHYFQARELRPLIDLCLRLYAERLGL
ncbi:MAG TPA: hypothetical protein VG963_20675 [Polyangiaceae bacterium]|nr:hypothetical protein [Polyangiaceae bacterium]